LTWPRTAAAMDPESHDLKAEPSVVATSLNFMPNDQAPQISLNEIFLGLLCVTATGFTFFWLAAILSDRAHIYIWVLCIFAGMASAATAWVLARMSAERKRPRVVIALLVALGLPGACYAAFATVLVAIELIRLIL